MTAPDAAEVRAAADVLDALNTHQGNGLGMPWRAEELRTEAESLEAEAQEAAENALVAEQLARDMCTATSTRMNEHFGVPAEMSWDGCAEGDREHWLAIAGLLVESGWRRDA